MLDTFALVALERSLTTLLRRDPAAPARLAALSGKTLRLNLADAHLGLRVGFHADGLTLSRTHPWQDADDLEITLTRHAVTRLVAGDSLERLLFSGQLPVTGQTALLPTIQALFMDLDLDWEGALAKGLGSHTAHGVASGIHHLDRQTRFMAREWHQDMREYLFEERRWLAGRDQLAVARDHLTELQQSVDRLGARVARLQRRQEPRS
jgi:ubiquinone biosynthesis protein UbiJ